ncbi:MAG: metal-dependent hydrolase [Alphaproteobacteria bacterium]|nr:metal-dependent hydrolase [Alphaproteobacteria bacterium]
MDSVTQFTLGACVGVAVLGRKIGPRRAALTGGVLGTLPDLDVFIAPDDPIDAFTQHRGWTHSLFVHAALTPLFGEVIRRLFKSLHDQTIQAYAAVFLCLTTHALLDAMTVYGTRLFWPFLTDPVGLGSIFIIDPLYTLPLLVLMVWAFFVRSMTPRLNKAAVVCIGISTAYLGWTVIAQNWITQRANVLLSKNGISPDRILAISTPFNSLVWRVIGIEGNRYFNLYMTVFDTTNTAKLYSYSRNLRFTACSETADRIAKVAKFSQGYYRVIVNGTRISVADVRMGLTPGYAFNFTLGQIKNGKLVTAPTVRLDRRGEINRDLEWLLAKLGNRPETRPAEAAAKIDLVSYAATKEQSNLPKGCRS